MTWAGFKMAADSNAAVVPRVVSSYQTRSGTATGYTGYLVPTIPERADLSMTEAVATCVKF
jgi:hypothetical protein